MTACVQAVGIKARTVYLMPKEYNTGDNHVVTHVYLEEESRWIMVDPSWNGYFSDKDGRIMDVFELRDAFANGKSASLNEEANHNGSPADEDYYKKYTAKNLYWFQITLGHTTYSSYPSGLDLTNWWVKYAEWQLKHGMKVENKKEYIEQLKKANYINLNKADFLKR